MADPVSLVLVSSVALTEGIKFLYAQASKILERRSARKEAAKKQQADVTKTEAANVQLPEVFQGQLSAPEIDFDEVERLHKPLLQLRSKLVNYAEGMLPVGHEDEDLMIDVEKLRLILESIYQQRITFKGEKREQSGTRVTTRVRLEEVAGKVTVTRIRELEGGVVETDAEVTNVAEEGELIVTDIGKMK